MPLEQEQPANGITAQTTIDTITRWHPPAALALLRHKVNCVGCYISGFHDVSTISERYGLDLDALLVELNEAIAEPSELDER